MITETRQKVKKIIEGIVSKGKTTTKISKPVGKFLTESIAGMLTSGSSNVTEISRQLKEQTKIKHRLKRLQRMLSSHDILPISNQICLSYAAKEVTDSTVLILDGGDITHLYGNKFENISLVRDGSSKKYLNGYCLNQIVGYNPETNRTFPVMLEMYSSVADNFLSANKEAFKIIRETVSSVGTKAIFAMDRGYDDIKYFGLMEELGCKFIIRMKSNRNLIVKGKSINIFTLASQINRRYKFKQYGKYGTQKVILQVRVNNRKIEKEFTLIAFKGKRNKNIFYYLTSGYVRSQQEIKRRLLGYFKRWSIEESYRFEKQGFGIEKATVRNFTSIRSLLGVTLLSWLVLFVIQKQARLKEEVLCSAKMEKIKPKNIPKFIYYRLLKGIQHLFEGVKTLFKFRLSKEQRLLNRLKAEDERCIAPFYKMWLEVL